METAIIAAGAVICGSLVTGWLAYLQARLNARSQLRQTNMVADREEHLRRYEQKVAVFAEYLATSTRLRDLIYKGAREQGAILKRSPGSMTVSDLADAAIEAALEDPAFKQLRSVGMQVLLFIDADEEKVLVDYEEQLVTHAARSGLAGSEPGDVGVDEILRPLVHMMRSHLARHAGEGKDITLRLG